MTVDYIKCGDSIDLLKGLDDESIDLTVTSPPYDHLRTYNGYSFDFEGIAKELFRITKEGGVLVWIVADGVVNGSETGASFRQALFFKDIGFSLNDTMIWKKTSFTYPEVYRYPQNFEYMFVFGKGKPKAFNPIRDRKNKNPGINAHGTQRQPDGSLKKIKSGIPIGEYGIRFNVWDISEEKNNKTGHPAVFPIRLAYDHIITWSNRGDTVLDPFMGSGSTALACIEAKRHYIGFDISEEYCNIARERIEEANGCALKRDRRKGYYQTDIFDFIEESV